MLICAHMATVGVKGLIIREKVGASAAYCYWQLYVVRIHIIVKVSAVSPRLAA